MGGMRRIKRNMRGNLGLPKKSVAQPIALVDAKIAVNGCQVFLGHPDPVHAKKCAAKYTQFLVETMARARIPNMSDMYNANFEMIHRLGKGESISSIIGKKDGQN